MHVLRSPLRGCLQLCAATCERQSGTAVARQGARQVRWVSGVRPQRPHSSAVLRAPRRWATVGEKTGGEEIVHDIESNDPFQNLGLTSAATPEEVAANFKKLAMLYHPDRPNGNEEHFQKLMKSKDSVLLRLGEKSEEQVAEDVTHHEAEYTYNEETTEWEYKRGRFRVYNDYIDSRVEKQRISVFMVQGCLLATVCWIFFEDFVEVWFSQVMSEDTVHREGRMFAQTKRKDYEREADRLYILREKKGLGENSTYTEEFRAEDPFADYHKKKRVVLHQSVLSRFISFVESFLPVFGQWLRLWLLPDTVSTRTFVM